MKKQNKEVLHLLVTSLCARNCKYCCNKQYDLNKIPYVSNEEFKNTEVICLTGGEPFMFSSPCAIAAYYKNKYSNIKQIYVYTNAAELGLYLQKNNIWAIDGVSVSIKSSLDKKMFENFIVNNKNITNLTSNLLYIFDEQLFPNEIGNFKIIKRDWQEHFVPANNSIFRRV